MPIRYKAGNSSTVTKVDAEGKETVIVLQENTSRLFASIYNNSNKDCYIKWGADCTTTSWSAILPKNGYMELPMEWVGEVSVYWDYNKPKDFLMVTEV